MKKKLLISILTLLTCSVFAFGFTACNDGTGGEGGIPGGEHDTLERHDHTEVAYVLSDTLHKKICTTCGEVLIPESEHVLDSKGYCTVCGYTAVGTEGLEYRELTVDGAVTSYYVADIGSATENEIIIPSYHDGLPVTRVEIYNCDFITDVIVGNNVTYVDNFKDCTSLANVTLPDSVMRIGNEAFSGTEYIANAERENGVLYIGRHLIDAYDTEGEYTVKRGTLSIADYAFGNDWPYHGNDLTAITIPEGVRSIGQNAFYGCSSINKISLPDSLERIGSGAFNDTQYFKDNGNWENNVLYIGKHLISANSKLTGEYTVKEGTLTVAEYSFGLSSCKITKAVLPESVKFVNEGAFCYCDGLNTVILNCIPVKADTYAFCSRELLNFQFNGTKEQWNAVEKGESIFSEELESIKCTDGTIYL